MLFLAQYPTNGIRSSRKRLSWWWMYCRLFSVSS